MSHFHLIEYQAKPVNALPDLPEPFAAPQDAVTLIAVGMHDILETQPSSHRMSTAVREWHSNAADTLSGVAEQIVLTARAQEMLLGQMRRQYADLHSDYAMVQGQARALSEALVAERAALARTLRAEWWFFWFALVWGLVVGGLAGWQAAIHIDLWEPVVAHAVAGATAAATHGVALVSGMVAMVRGWM